MKKSIAALLALLILLSLAGCGEEVPVPIDYTALFEEYADAHRTDPHDRLEAEIFVISNDYMLVHYSGADPSLVLYQVRIHDGKATILSSAHGEIPTSGCISINHLETEGTHFYFGMLNDTHFNPVDNSVIPAGWDTLMMEKEHTPGVEDLTMASREVHSGSGFWFTLSAPLVDFEAINKDGQVFLDLEAFLAQGYTIAEAELIPVK